MKKASVIKNYIYNTVYQVLVLTAPLITTPYVSRVLGATGIGIYSYAQSIATYFMLAGAVGTTIYGQREIAFARDDKKRRSEVFWQITLLRCAGVFIFGLIYFLIFGFGTEYRSVYQVLMVEIIATAFDVSWFFMGLENFKITVIRNTFIKLIGIFAVFLFVKSSDDVLIYTMCLTLPIFIGNISLWFSLPKYLVKVKIHPHNVIEYLKPSLILFLPQLAIEVYTVLDKTMLGIFASNIDEVGYYTQASKIIKVALTLVTSLGTVMLPAMSYAFAQGKTEVIVKSIKKAFHFVFMLGFAILFGICGVAKTFVPIFFGPEYDEVAVLMIVISPILIIISMSNVIGKQYLLPTKQEKYYTISVFTGAAVNFVLNWVLIMEFDAIGASIATVCAELSVLLVQTFLVRKQLNLFKCFLPAIKYLICGGIMCVVVYFIGEVLGKGVKVLLIQIAIGFAVYAIELLITRDSMLIEGINMVMKQVKK